MSNGDTATESKQCALEELRPGARVVTIGTFDGVHRGHQSLIDAASKRAGELGLPITAITFEPIPAMVLRPDRFPGRICPTEEKHSRLASLPLDEIVTVAFDRELSQQAPETFMAMLAERTGLVELWVGEAFALGKNRSGDVERLGEIGQELGFSVTAVPRLSDEGHVISSSAIRAAIQAGDVARARRYLGRPFSVSGEVVHGAHLGRTIGYPTANVVPPAELVGLADGIYVSLTRLPGEAGSRPSMTYVGTRPTVNSGERLIETHLLDFEGDLYGRVIRVDMLERLRGDETFAGVEALIAQLKEDEAATRRYLAAGVEAVVEN
jgi:riboflavin kinase/FMN adenylyltransferase